MIGGHVRCVRLLMMPMAMFTLAIALPDYVRAVWRPPAHTGPHTPSSRFQQLLIPNYEHLSAIGPSPLIVLLRLR